MSLWELGFGPACLWDRCVPPGLEEISLNPQAETQGRRKAGSRSPGWGPTLSPLPGLLVPEGLWGPYVAPDLCPHPGRPSNPVDTRMWLHVMAGRQPGGAGSPVLPTLLFTGPQGLRRCLLGWGVGWQELEDPALAGQDPPPGTRAWWARGSLGLSNLSKELSWVFPGGPVTHTAVAPGRCCPDVWIFAECEC